MKIWITTTYKGLATDCFEVIIHNEDPRSRDITIRLDRLIDVIQKQKKYLKKLRKMSAADLHLSHPTNLKIRNPEKKEEPH